MNTLKDKLSDLFMFREGTEADDRGSLVPVLTTGSIVWGILLRTSVIVFLSFSIIYLYDLYKYVWVVLFALWFGAAYPGWRQFQLFQERIKKVTESTLCGSCMHFDKTSQLCKIYDEHVTREYIPCEGLNWEPINYEENH